MSDTQAIALHNPQELVLRLSERVMMLEGHITTVETIVKNQGDALRFVMAAALRRIAEELESSDSTVVPSAAPAPGNAKWESWKKSLPGRPAEFIDLLLIHGEMTTAQLMAAAKCAKQTVYDTASKMTKAGILSSGGGKYRLKDL